MMNEQLYNSQKRAIARPSVDYDISEGCCTEKVVLQMCQRAPVLQFLGLEMFGKCPMLRRLINFKSLVFKLWKDIDMKCMQIVEKLFFNESVVSGLGMKSSRKVICSIYVTYSMRISRRYHFQNIYSARIFTPTTQNHNLKNPQLFIMSMDTGQSIEAQCLISVQRIKTRNE